MHLDKEFVKRYIFSLSLSLCTSLLCASVHSAVQISFPVQWENSAKNSGKGFRQSIFKHSENLIPR